MIEKESSTAMPPAYAFFVSLRWPSFLLGNVLVVVWPIAHLVDLMVNLSFYAPNPYCDSLGIPIIGAILLTVIMVPIINVVIHLSTRHLFIGKEAVRFREKWHAKHTLAIAVFCVMAIPVIVDQVSHFIYIVPHNVTTNCNGTAEAVTRTVNWKPSFVYELWVLVWVFFVSVLSISLACTTEKRAS